MSEWIKGIVNIRHSVLITHRGNFEISEDVKIPIEPRFWVAEVQDNKVVKFIKPFVPRRLKESIGKCLLRASMPGIWAAPMSYALYDCYYCRNEVSRNAVKIAVLREDGEIDLCYNCAVRFFGEDYPTVMNAASQSGEVWMGAIQPATVIAPLKYALRMKSEAGGLIDFVNISKDETYVYQERFKDPEVIRIPRKYRDLIENALRNNEEVRE